MTRAGSSAHMVLHIAWAYHSPLGQRTHFSGFSEEWEQPLLKDVDAMNFLEIPVLTANKTVSKSLLNLSARFRANRLASQYARDEAPLRSELFSAEQMEQHGKRLASL